MYVHKLERSGITDIQTKAEKLLLACANVLEIRCPHCCKYEYWTYSEDIKEMSKTE